MRAKLICFCAMLLCAAVLLSACGSGAAPASGDGAGSDTAPDAGTLLHVHCFSAGKADAFLLYTGQSAVLIDCGEKGFGKEILAFLEAEGIQKLDALIITHFDKDHVGGAARVLNNFPVDTVLQSNYPKDSEEYEKYCTALANAGLEAVTVGETLDFTLDGVRYTVDPPRKQSYSADPSNNSSLIVAVRNGENSLLFTGDSQDARLAEFLSGDWGSFDVLKVPYHGHAQPLLQELIAAVAPSLAVITSSDAEPEDPETLALLDAAGAEVWLTREGAVDLLCDGVTVTASRGASEALAA